MRKYLFLLSAVALIAVMLSGCFSANMARLEVKLTDAVPENVKEVWVEISEVRLKSSDDIEDGTGTVILSQEKQFVDLLSLREIPMVLADASIPAGTYDQIQFVVTSSKLVLSDGSEPELFIPGPGYHYEQSNPDLLKETVVKGILKDAIFESGKRYGLTIDFQVNNNLSLHVTGSERYILRPVIHVVLDDVSGRITGKVVAVIEGTETALEGATVQVSYGEQVVAETSTDAEGFFYANALLLSEHIGGDYTVTITSEGYQPFAQTVNLDEVEENMGTIILTK